MSHTKNFIKEEGKTLTEKGKTLTKEQKQENDAKIDEIYTKEYGLPALLDGSDEQNSYAVSIRNQFLTEFGNMAGELSDKTKEKVITFVTKQNSAIYWLDNIKKKVKGHYFTRYLKEIPKHEASIAQKTLTPAPTVTLSGTQKPFIQSQFTQNQPVFVPTVSDVFKLYVGYQTKVQLRTADHELDEKLTELKLNHLNEFFWEIKIDKDDVERTHVVEDIKNLILNTGKNLKLDMDSDDSSPVSEDSDAKLTRINGELAVICKSTEVARAFERIGYKLIYLDESRKEEIKPLLQRYHVEIDDALKGEFQ